MSVWWRAILPSISHFLKTRFQNLFNKIICSSSMCSTFGNSKFKRDITLALCVQPVSLPTILSYGPESWELYYIRGIEESYITLLSVWCCRTGRSYNGRSMDVQHIRKNQLKGNNASIYISSPIKRIGWGQPSFYISKNYMEKKLFDHPNFISVLILYAIDSDSSYNQKSYLYYMNKELAFFAVLVLSAVFLFSATT